MTPKRSLARTVAVALGATLLLASTSCSRPRDEHPDVILITVASLRADAPGFMGGHVETPAMDSLAAAGVVFTGALTTAPQTLPSLASLHSGLYPLSTGVHDDGVSRLAEGK